MTKVAIIEIAARTETVLVTYHTFSLAICDPPCENGGLCVQSGHCSCPAGWKGATCTNGECHA